MAQFMHEVFFLGRNYSAFSDYISGSSNSFLIEHAFTVQSSGESPIMVMCPIFLPVRASLFPYKCSEVPLVFRILFQSGGVNSSFHTSPNKFIIMTGETSVVEPSGIPETDLACCSN